MSAPAVLPTCLLVCFDRSGSMRRAGERTSAFVGQFNGADSNPSLSLIRFAGRDWRSRVKNFDGVEISLSFFREILRASPSGLQDRGISATFLDMKEIVFTVTAEESGGFSASWDDPCGGGISTQGDDLTHLQAMIRDAVLCHFDEGEVPARARLHFTEDPALAFA